MVTSDRSGSIPAVESSSATVGRGCVKTQSQFPRFRFWRFLIKKFAQNRATIDLIALFYAAKLVVTSFYTASANTSHLRLRFSFPKAAFRYRQPGVIPKDGSHSTTEQTATSQMQLRERAAKTSR
jgi:hypothetical protein